eukprot:186346_1
MATKLPIYSWAPGSSPPNLASMIKFGMFLANYKDSWDKIQEDLADIATSFEEPNALTGLKDFANGVGNVAAPLINAATVVLQLYTQISYIQNKMKLCTWDIGKKKPPLAFGFDIVFDFGPIIGQKGIKNLCSLYSSRRRGLSSDEERRRLAALMISYPIIPAISLPCIPIFPPALMLCPAIDVSTKFGLDIDPELS